MSTIVPVTVADMPVLFFTFNEIMNAEYVFNHLPEAIVGSEVTPLEMG